MHDARIDPEIYNLKTITYMDKCNILTCCSLWRFRVELEDSDLISDVLTLDLDAQALTRDSNILLSHRECDL